MASKKKTAVTPVEPGAIKGTILNPEPDVPSVADISEQEMKDSEDLRKLNARLREEHGINLAEAINRIFWRHGFGADMRDRD